MFARKNIAQKVQFDLYRSETVEGVSGSRADAFEPDMVIYGRLRSRNFARMNEQGQINQDVTHELVCDYFKPFPQSGDRLKRGSQNWVVHVVENELEFNQTLRLLISRDGSDA